jgi:hypothetical protein
MPTPLGSVGAAAVGGKIHVIGGRGVGGNTASQEQRNQPVSKYRKPHPLECDLVKLMSC